MGMENASAAGDGLTIVVLVKQVPDMNAVKIDRGSGLPTMSGQMVVSSYDEHAIEEALRLKEQHGGEVTVVSAGPPGVKEAITRALAMGADKGLLIEAPNARELDSLAVATLLSEHLRGLNADLILAGQAADDTETGQVGAQVAELLDLPLVSSVIEVQVDGAQLTVRRDMEDGHQTVETAMPAVLLASTGLNEPRHQSLKGIMAAKRKPLEQVAGSTSPEGTRLSWSEPVAPERTITGTIVQDVPPAEAADRLVAWLQDQKLI